MAYALRYAAFGVFGIADWTWSNLSNVSGLTYASKLPVNCLQQFPSYARQRPKPNGITPLEYATVRHPTPSCVIPRCLWCWCDCLGQRLQNKQHHGTRPSSQQFHGIQRLAVWSDGLSFAGAGVSVCVCARVQVHALRSFIARNVWSTCSLIPCNIFYNPLQYLLEWGSCGRTESCIHLDSSCVVLWGAAG